MQTRRLSIEGAVEFTPKQHWDSRGLFLEWFRVRVLGSIAQGLSLLHEDEQHRAEAIRRDAVAPPD